MGVKKGGIWAEGALKEGIAQLRRVHKRKRKKKRSGEGRYIWGTPTEKMEEKKRGGTRRG